MTNEFGAALDHAGYAASIMQQNRNGRCCCYLCGRPTGWSKLDRHEPWGAANRRKSQELGLWVLLCHEGCHEGPGSVHADGAKARELRKDAQRAAMLRYGWSREEWIARFGKSELSEDEAKRLIVLPAEDTSSAPAGHLPPEGKATKEPDCRAGNRERVAALIRELWPDHPTTTRGGSAFRTVDGPELPF